MESKPQLPVLTFATKIEFEKWLNIHSELQSGIWLKFYKKNSGTPTVTYTEALDVALSYGWIDGQLKRLDEFAYIQKFTPRRKKAFGR